MNPWLVLDISETNDKHAVKHAYFSQLSKHNPEDDPEGFKKVREAYEQILAGIDKASEDTPISLFMKKVELLYNNFSQRISVACWKELLTEDICMQLATEDIVSKEILEFLMDHWYLPSAVFQTLDAHFGWLAKKGELKTMIPAGFIDYIENQIQSEYPRYDLFDTDKNPDRFISLFFEAEGLINKNELNGVDPLIAEMEETGVTHPYFLHLKARLALRRSEIEKALTFAKSALSQYPDDIYARYTYALVLCGTEKAKEALPYFQAILDEQPSHYSSERGIVECLISLEEYEEAREFLLKSLDKYPSNGFFLGAFQHVSELLVEKYLKMHQENPEDIETTFTLAKHYLNRSKYEECIALLTEYANPGCHPRYYQYIGECFLRRGDAEKAVDYLVKGLSVQKEYRDYINLALALCECRRYNDAIRYADEGLSLTDNDLISKARLYYTKGLAYYKMKQYDEALAIFNIGITANDQLQYLYTAKANVYKDMSRFAEAIDCCLEAIALQPYNAEPYVIELDIYFTTNQYQRILDLIDQTKDYSISEHTRVKFYWACALARMSREEEGLDILSELILSENLNDEEYKPRIYRELSYISECQGNFRQAAGYIQKAIAFDKKAQWPEWEITLGQIYNKLGDSKNAIKIFNRLIKEGTHGTKPYLERGVSYLLKNRPRLTKLSFNKAIKMDESDESDYDRIIQIYSDWNRHLEALKWADLEIKLYDSAENRMQKAWVLVNLRRNEEAIRYLEKSKEDFPENEGLCHRLAYYYSNIISDHEKALGEYKTILDLNPEWPNIYEDTAHCLGLLNKYDEAMDLLNEVIDKTPDNVSLYARRGRLYMDLNRQYEALEDLLRAVTDTDMLNSYWYLHVIYYWIGHLYEMFFNDAESALKYYHLSLEWNNEYPSSLASIGDIHFYLKNYKEAANWYSQAIWTGSNDGENLLKRGNAYIKLGRNLSARFDYKTALKLYRHVPVDACRHAHVGEIYLGLRKYRKALKHFNRAIENAANCAHCPPKICHEAYFYMCVYYAKKGKFEKAKEYLDIAIKSANSIQYNQFKLELAKKQSGI